MRMTAERVKTVNLLQFYVE